MLMNRVWAMPNADTFSVPPIGEFVKRYLSKSKVSIDPFARNKQWATYTNDLNPKTLAQYHMDAYDYLKMLCLQGVKADLVIVDPPYSPRQVKECYESIGKHMTTEDGWRTHAWSRERALIDELLVLGGTVLTFGWNSCGMGIEMGYEMIELLLVCHGSGHSDTICVAEVKRQAQLFALYNALEAS